MRRAPPRWRAASPARGPAGTGTGAGPVPGQPADPADLAVPPGGEPGVPPGQVPPPPGNGRRPPRPAPPPNLGPPPDRLDWRRKP